MQYVCQVDASMGQLAAKSLVICVRVPPRSVCAKTGCTSLSSVGFAHQEWRYRWSGCSDGQAFRGTHGSAL